MIRTEQFGVHLMFDGYGASPERLSNLDMLRNLLKDLPRALGMHAICEPCVVEVGPLNRKDPGGLSGFVMIAESHISFHTFPARRFVSADVYTCQNDMDTEKVKNLLSIAFWAESAEVNVVPRGTRYPAENLV
ncbi:S-adenosylmethionine decarboxylase [Hydrogenophaga sp. RWCD_12]|uniref:S-adenosylmethionine decarboxylase n=1 Tax=Hydrogenophaga sp. RWCD_12 TaxID=3391190 RepID=UPI003984A4E6